jgi:hypothetical protein
VSEELYTVKGAETRPETSRESGAARDVRKLGDGL